VQYHCDAELAAEALWIARERCECVGGGREEQIEDALARTLGDGAQLCGQGEDDVEVVHWEDAFEALFDPTRLCKGLALGAVPIAARIVRRLLWPHAVHTSRCPPSTAVLHCTIARSAARSSKRSKRLAANVSP
jgi:hypothetical protein